MHPLEMRYRLDEIECLAKEITSPEEIKKELERGWANGWIYVSYEVLGFDMLLKLSLGWHRFKKDGRIKYAWCMNMDPIQFNDDTMNGHLGELYRRLLDIDNSFYRSHLFYQDGGFNMQDHIMDPKDILDLVDEVDFNIVDGWNSGCSFEDDTDFFDLCGDDSFVKASDSFRYCMGMYQEQRTEWCAFCAEMSSDGW